MKMGMQGSGIQTSHIIIIYRKLLEIYRQLVIMYNLYYIDCFKISLLYVYKCFLVH